MSLCALCIGLTTSIIVFALCAVTIAMLAGPRPRG
jgi:hypothetical protein